MRLQARSRTTSATIQITTNAAKRLVHLGACYEDLLTNAECQEVAGLATTLQQCTQALLTSPYCPSTWLKRSKTLLRLQYPELACGDAFKALQLINISRGAASEMSRHIRREIIFEVSEDLMIGFQGTGSRSEWITDQRRRLEHSAILTLAQGLLMANSSLECLNFLQENAGKFPGELELATLRKAARAAINRETQSLMAPGTSQRALEEALGEGEVYIETYPWTSSKALRRSALLPFVNKNLGRRSSQQCYVKRSSIRDKVIMRDPEGFEDAMEVLGIFAKTEILAGRRVLRDPTCLCAIDDTAGRCSSCGGRLPAILYEHQSCCRSDYCSEACLQTAYRFYHSAVCGRDFGQINRAIQSSTVSQKTVTERRLLLRALALAVKCRGLHPLQAPIISHLTSPQGGHENLETQSFSLARSIIEPITMLTRFGIDVYANHNFDTWVVLTIEGRLRINSRDNHDDISTESYYIAINPYYTFFNHSCRPNVAYEGRKGGPKSTVRMKASRDIEAGDELFITYLSEDDLNLHVTKRQEKLRQWFGHDCQCERCVEEMKDEIQEDSKSEDECMAM